MSEVKLHVELLSYTPNPEEVVAMAAKLCYSAADIDTLKEGIASRDQSSFISKLIKMGHLSPIEHASFTFGVEGVSRSLLAQITRHRIASFSVKSQRYVSEMSEGERTFNYIIPESIKALGQPYVDKFRQQMTIIQSWYDEWVQLLGNKGETSYQDARFVLPNAAETKFMVTMNARELLHFFGLRCCNRAQWEIRNLAKEMLKLVLRVAPNIFINAGPGCVRGECPEGVMTCGKASEVRKEFEDIYREYGGLK
ncbi:thymidylate synthase (FAD) [Caldicoprobacter guelmensis]|uniref:FAD-dependent thymidylate synthase n=1 Tax=Caldicoprobacter guelmensis TaxID=1170224 RepID=UPI00311CA0DE|nr:thymidylate synthase (FAD) [Caldicoprobacter guelmensis]